MTFKEEYEQLIKKRDNLLNERKNKEEQIKKLNQLIDYYSWTYNSCLFEENCYNENILSYRKLLNRPKNHSLLDFSFFDNNFNKYYLNRIKYFEKKIEETKKKKNSVGNLIVIKKRERDIVSFPESII